MQSVVTTSNITNRFRANAQNLLHPPYVDQFRPNSSSWPPRQPYLNYCQIFGIQCHTTKICLSFWLTLVQSSNNSNSLMHTFSSPWKPWAHLFANTSNTPTWLFGQCSFSRHVTWAAHLFVHNTLISRALRLEVAWVLPLLKLAWV